MLRINLIGPPESVPKRCTKCTQVKSRSEFHGNKWRKDGHTEFCKPCNSRHAGEWQRAFPERRNARARQHRKETLDDARLSKERAWAAAWREARPDRVKAAYAKWVAAHPERVEENRARYRRRVESAPGGCSRVQWGERLKAFGDMCAYCRFSPVETVDHGLPLSRGGSKNPDNSYPSCRRCNSQKKDKTPDEWISRWYMDPWRVLEVERGKYV